MYYKDMEKLAGIVEDNPLLSAGLGLAGGALLARKKIGKFLTRKAGEVGTKMKVKGTGLEQKALLQKIKGTGHHPERQAEMAEKFVKLYGSKTLPRLGRRGAHLVKTDKGKYVSRFTEEGQKSLQSGAVKAAKKEKGQLAKSLREQGLKAKFQEGGGVSLSGEWKKKQTA